MRLLLYLILGLVAIPVLFFSGVAVFIIAIGFLVWCVIKVIYFFLKEQ